MCATATTTYLESSTGASLDDLLAARVLPRLWLARTWSVCELPRHLARCARDLTPDLAWRAYGDADHPLFVIARAHKPEQSDGGRRTLDVYFLDGRSVVHCAGVWAFHDRHGWRRVEADDD